MKAAEREFTEYTGGEPLGHVVYSASQIADCVARMGADIAAAYPPDADILLLGLLKGSFVFLGDLVRQIRRPLQVDFLVASSYGKGTESSGNVELLYDPRAPMAGRHIILVEDIVDSGTTLNQLCGALVDRGPASFEICALLHKRIAPDLEWEPRWVGFDAPNEFLVGYGLDHGEDFRHLPFIACPGT
ncbi:hypoxanthine phosphoribosyltransferase [Candidatus Palauibacter sp.]|uniref:hypoxanthine phosphoribosyltransferase n=1 Tax=Candidatus Palauibacter sp. TaxID=3101350 RepID=UPI003B0204E3